MSDYEWPLEQGRQFDSEFFTKEELWQQCQQNHWLRSRDVEDGIYTQYPTNDYSFSPYKCNTLEELAKAFLHGNWSIRACFTYKNLAFVNQINAGDEWLTIKKFDDGKMLSFESITMVAVINHEVSTWVEDIAWVTEPEALESLSEEQLKAVGEGGAVPTYERYVYNYEARDICEARTKEFHEKNPDHPYKHINYLAKGARYTVGKPKSETGHGIYFTDKAENYWPGYIQCLLDATYEQCRTLDYIPPKFREKWRD